MSSVMVSELSSEFTTASAYIHPITDNIRSQMLPKKSPTRLENPSNKASATLNSLKLLIISPI